MSLSNFYRSVAGESLVTPGEPIVLLTSAARTATTYSSYVAVPNWARSAVAYLEATASGAAGTLKMKIFGRRDASAAFVGYYEATDGTGIIGPATGPRMLIASRDATGTLPPSGMVAGTWGLTWPEIGVEVTHDTANSFTYSVQLWFLP